MTGPVGEGKAKVELEVSGEDTAYVTLGIARLRELVAFSQAVAVDNTLLSVGFSILNNS